VVRVAVAVSTVAENADAGVVPFEGGVGHAVPRPGQDALLVANQHPPRVLQRLEPLPAKHPAPAFELGSLVGRQPVAAAPVTREVQRLPWRGGRLRDEKVAGLCSDLYLRRPALWTFAREPGVEPRNNAAEQALRHAVLWRRSSFVTV